jgi:hypothetical protein
MKLNFIYKYREERRRELETVRTMVDEYEARLKMLESVEEEDTNHNSKEKSKKRY